MSERFAFLSANNKVGIPRLATALHERGVHIISMGETARTITEGPKTPRGIEVIDPLDFLKDALVRELYWTIKLPDARRQERARREFVGQRLSDRMGQSRSDLQVQNLDPIDFTYINLRPPKYDPTTQGISSDKGGVNMIKAAMEGGRATITFPEQTHDAIHILHTAPDNTLWTPEQWQHLYDGNLAYLAGEEVVAAQTRRAAS